MGKLKCDDEVIVLSGKDKGKRGRLREFVGTDRAVVTDVNMVKKHTKPNPQAGVTGGIVDREAPIHLSNLGIFNPATNKADRVGYTRDARGRKRRVFRSSGEAIDG